MTPIRSLAGLALGLVLLAPAQTATPPAAASAPAGGDRPIRIVVPYAPGGFTDIVARLVAMIVGKTLPRAQP